MLWRDLCFSQMCYLNISPSPLPCCSPATTCLLEVATLAEQCVCDGCLIHFPQNQLHQFKQFIQWFELTSFILYDLDQGVFQDPFKQPQLWVVEISSQPRKTPKRAGSNVFSRCWCTQKRASAHKIKRSFGGSSTRDFHH